jgi:diguanylate cyclase (GGDEF)-like protein
MITDGTIIRLLLSQAIAVYFLLLLTPIRKPVSKHIGLIVFGTLLITLANAGIILIEGITFYTRFYMLTLVIPYFIVFSHFAIYRGARLIFSFLTIQVIGNLAIINGLFASYIFYGENTPYLDIAARIITYMLFLPIIMKLIRPTYIKMVEMLKKGWWILDTALVLAYALAYFVLFVPNPIFERPEYFVHGYFAIFLALIIYAIIFFLFIEVQLKSAIEHDKEQLNSQFASLEAESAAISTIAYKDPLTGVNNRYALYKRMDRLIVSQEPFLVVFMDLDNLKLINDAFDHSKGDSYLRQFALAAEHVMRHQGELFRFAGDEFVGIITKDVNSFDPEHLKIKIAEEIKLDVPYNNMSLGIARFPEDGDHPDLLINHADQVMYLEKKTKKNMT